MRCRRLLEDVPMFRPTHALCWTALIVSLLPAAMAEPWKKDQVLYRREGRYSAFPSLYQEGDRLWVSFGWNTTRSHYGKAAGGETGGVVLYSPDGGQSWVESGKLGFCNVPLERRMLRLSDGTLISIGAAMHEMLPGEKKQELERLGVAVKEWPGGHISASYRVRMTRQLPRQTTRSIWVELPPVASIANFGFGVALPGDVLLKPVYGLAKLDDPAWRAWCLRSEDRGEHWQLVTMAYDRVHPFNEADLLALPDGRVLAMIRIEGGRGKVPAGQRGFLWQTESNDSGRTWSSAVRTNMWGYPPTLLRLRDGRILCSYGYRRPPYGIRACFSRDGGRTWDTEHEVILRDDALPDGPATGKGSPSDLGYPRSVALSDGSIFTVYYITLGDGVTHIAASRWSPDYLGPSELRRGATAIGSGKPDPRLPPERLLGEVGPQKFDYGVMQSFIPTQPQITAIAVRVSKQSGRPELVFRMACMWPGASPTATSGGPRALPRRCRFPRLKCGLGLGICSGSPSPCLSFRGRPTC